MQNEKQKQKHLLRWGVIILAALAYLAIMAIPFLNSVETDKKGLLGILTVGEIIVLGIMVALLVAVIVLLFKKRERVSRIMREYESEVKRVTWLSWKDTKRSSGVVLIGLALCALVICLLDVGLAKGFLWFITDLF